jgi:aspartate/methionine/tyrosine aminotransferase
MKYLSKASMELEGQKMFQIFEKAQEMEKNGIDIIHLEIGDPDFNTPKNVVEAAVSSLRKGNTHYVKSSGMDSLKEASIQRSIKSRGFAPQKNQILVTAGANIQIYYALACLANPGDEIVTVDPCFVSYKSIIKFLGLKPVFVPLRESNEFKINPTDLESAITDKTRVILINSPHNPTGSVLSEEDMRKIYQIAEDHDLYLLSDEVYGRMVYEDDKSLGFFSPSAIDQCKQRSIIIHSLSKSYAMTGWRIGAVTGPSNVIEKMTLLLETTSSCVSPFIQEAAIEALSSNQNAISSMIGEFKFRRDLMVSMINNIPNISCTLPKGAFYAFANIKNTGMSDTKFCEYILEELGVAACPGSYFGDYGKGYVRFCFANSQENITKAMDRIRNHFTDIN